jgi:endonuclease G
MEQLMKLIAFLALFSALLPARQDRFGYPACSGPDRELADRTFFTLCHSASRKVPLWVAYELKPQHLNPRTQRPSRFHTDYQLARPGALDSDYKYSGFTRGHMAPAADFAFSDKAIRSTFILSNAVPQRQSVNSGRWRQLEDAVRNLAASSDSVIIFTGPIFDSSPPEFIGEGRVAVPSHTFKVVLLIQATRKTMLAAIIPNQSGIRQPLDDFSVSVDEVESRTGLDFFSALEDREESALESVRANWR